MRISPITSLLHSNNIKNDKISQNSAYVTGPSRNDSFVKAPVSAGLPHSVVSFNGYDVHIVAGGAEVDDLAKFAKAISKSLDIDLYTHKPEEIRGGRGNKFLKNIELQLKEMNRLGGIDEKSFVAIPVKISVSLQNLAEQYKQVMGYYLHLRPQSTKTCQKKLLDFLKVLYENPNKYRKYIDYMDPKGEGLEYAYGIIQEINKLNTKHVYVASEAPYKSTLNWISGEWNAKPELTNYLATGYDSNNRVNDMANYMKREGWYDFNLLALSDANVVNLKKIDGYSDHIHSAYDTTINEGARGVYNLTPVRENGKIKGFSFNDNETVEYPYFDFPYKSQLRVTGKFVGLDVKDVVADDFRTEQFKQALREGRDTSEFSDKLYPTWKVFDEYQMNNDKIYLKGDFVDSSLQYYFRRNGEYKIIYPKEDVESSGRPSIRGMWGSGYSIFNIIKRDVNNQQFLDNIKNDKHIDIEMAMHNCIAAAFEDSKVGNFYKADSNMAQAIDYITVVGFDRRNYKHMRAYEKFADIKFDKGDYESANGLYNFFLNNLCKNYVEDSKVKQFLETEKDRKHIIQLYHRLAEIAHRRGEEIPERECIRAASEIVHGSKLGTEIIARRANDDPNIGDMF